MEDIDNNINYDNSKLNYNEFMDLLIKCTTLPETYHNTVESKFLWKQMISLFYILSKSFQLIL